MKKIMFSDKFGLTQAVLDGRKTMTRRVINERTEQWLRMQYGDDHYRWLRHSPYQYLEEVAVAQSYEDIFVTNDFPIDEWIDKVEKAHSGKDYRLLEGTDNKMFVKADLMPHRILIKDIKVERLQDISNVEAMKEGIWRDDAGGSVVGSPIGIPYLFTFDHIFSKNNQRLHWTTPRKAFAALIDKINGKGTWERNPFVFAYSFELVKKGASNG